MKRLGFVTVLGISYVYASACCGVSSNGMPVKFGDQSNIIVWNPETKIEHFVRNASFDTRAKDFGFIAPTPEAPKLEVADSAAFGTLSGLKPKPFVMGCSAPTEEESASASSRATGVEVLQDVTVGKYQATTIKSKDPEALAEYLKTNGYASTPAFQEWIADYAKKDWVFTAFKVRQGQEGITESGTIRMSFKADRPFNPYYVPSDNSKGAGTLRIYFVSDGKYSATVGESGRWNHSEWDAPVPDWAKSSVAASLKIPAADLPNNATVTYFEKYDWLQGSKEDLFFSKSSNPAGIVIGGVLALLGGGLWWFTKTRKARMAQIGA